MFVSVRARWNIQALAGRVGVGRFPHPTSKCNDCFHARARKSVLSTILRRFHRRQTSYLSVHARVPIWVPTCQMGLVGGVL